MRDKLRKLLALAVIAAFALAGVLFIREQFFIEPEPNPADLPAVSVQQPAQPEAPQPAGQDTDPEEPEDVPPNPQGGLPDDTVAQGGSYTERDEIALYLHLYGDLPANFLTKREAEALGWDSAQGNLDEVAPGMSIGGDRFGNYEQALPDAPGRTWRECDVAYTGGYRGAQRIVYSNDGLIYYTDDHYETFERLY